jgi:hypothetical protein
VTDGVIPVATTTSVGISLVGSVVSEGSGGGTMILTISVEVGIVVLISCATDVLVFFTWATGDFGIIVGAEVLTNDGKLFQGMKKAPRTKSARSTDDMNKTLAFLLGYSFLTGGKTETLKSSIFHLFSFHF